jgi:hypothetical protein
MFQRIMTNLLRDLPFVRVYFDNILIFNKNMQCHEEYLKIVKQRLQEHGLTINFEKSELRKTTIIFLGHVICKNTVRPSNSNVQTIQEFTEPTSKKDLQSFLGLTNFVLRFMPDYSSKTAKLRQLLPKDMPFQWTSEHARAFQEIKEVVGHRALTVFDPKATFIVLADASPFGLGAVLIQQKAGMKPKIIAYASRSLTQMEQKYFHTEKEALALVWACERFRLYIVGKQLELHTDHKPLEVLFGQKYGNGSARIER